MTLLLIAPVSVFGGLAQITPSESQRSPLALMALVVVGLILFVALTGLLAWLGRRAPAESAQGDRQRLPLVARAGGFERGIAPAAGPADSVPDPPALQPGFSTTSDPSGAGVARGRAHGAASPRPPLG